MIHFNFLPIQYMSSLLQANPAAHSNPWLSYDLHEHWLKLRVAERKWHKSKLIFTNKTKTISSQFSSHTQDLKPTTSTAKNPLFPFSSVTEPEELKPPLQPSYNMPSRPNPLTTSPSNHPSTHIINTSLLVGIFHTKFKRARVTPLLRIPTLNTSLTYSYRHVSLHS